MQVMTEYDFFDGEIECVRAEGHEDVRKIVIQPSNEGSILVTKEDIVAFAKEFGLVVYEKSSAL